jgi:hypothetical protein
MNLRAILMNMHLVDSVMLGNGSECGEQKGGKHSATTTRTAHVHTHTRTAARVFAPEQPQRLSPNTKFHETPNYK